ncbi:hypothetical protein U729_3261 (plasmid) [Clostridium baratii str. Sullivan]|uniref:Uncharacterized protein n=1 Tax=Clostridium baratii str. Sullivan TaxID=1415775 RepID=A0A0A7G0B9_9CLOT|nr:hypothetical protein [Clostridium baratii]AIY85283.1 hypothetical protein U729_3261 [Clostridium baratii str. Sullivan]
MYNRDNDVERIFHMDVFEKKKSGRGVYNRASRKGFIRGGVKTQYDFLSRSEKKLLNGEVIMSNVYDDIKNIPSLVELEKKDPQAITSILKTIKAKHPVKKLTEHFGISMGKLYTLFNKYGVEYEIRSKKITPTAGTKNDKQVQTKLSIGAENNGALPDIARRFKLMDKQQRKEYITDCVIKGYDTNDIAKATGLAAASISTYYSKYGIDVVGIKEMIKKGELSVDSMNEQADTTNETKTVVVKNSDTIIEAQKVDEAEIHHEPTPVMDAETKRILDEQLKLIEQLKNEVLTLNNQLAEEKNKQGISLSLNGLFTGEEIETKVLGLIGAIDKEFEYTVEFKLNEVQK